uniref:Uncharacterized protein n=1 Tax=Kalanchoe fedtschenkoi TaxID=63787 RepID=A0A7N0UW36_KALFE
MLIIKLTHSFHSLIILISTRLLTAFQFNFNSMNSDFSLFDGITAEFPSRKSVQLSSPPLARPPHISTSATSYDHSQETKSALLLVADVSKKKARENNKGVRFEQELDGVDFFESVLCHC